MLKTLLLVSAITLVANGAQAAICGPHEKIVATLHKQYEELPTAVGISNSGRLLEILVHRDGASWTVLLTSPEGVSCVIDAGESWMLIDQVKFMPKA